MYSMLLMPSAAQAEDQQIAKPILPVGPLALCSRFTRPLLLQLFAACPVFTIRTFYHKSRKKMLGRLIALKPAPMIHSISRSQA
jgi:hypothetical protein